MRTTLGRRRWRERIPRWPSSHAGWLSCWSAARPPGGDDLSGLVRRLRGGCPQVAGARSVAETLPDPAARRRGAGRSGIATTRTGGGGHRCHPGPPRRTRGPVRLGDHAGHLILDAIRDRLCPVNLAPGCGRPGFPSQAARMHSGLHPPTRVTSATRSQASSGRAATTSSGAAVSPVTADGGELLRLRHRHSQLPAAIRHRRRVRGNHRCDARTRRAGVGLPAGTPVVPRGTRPNRCANCRPASACPKPAADPSRPSTDGLSRRPPQPAPSGKGSPRRDIPPGRHVRVTPHGGRNSYRSGRAGPRAPATPVS
jgi:hypothetical protein